VTGAGIVYVYETQPAPRLVRFPDNTVLISTNESVGLAYTMLADLFHSTAVARISVGSLRHRILGNAPFRIGDAELWALLCGELSLDVREAVDEATR
jgi:hypothetical protein